MCQFWNQNSVKLGLSQSVDRNVEKVYFDIVILKCYQTATHYMGNVTLSLVVLLQDMTRN